MARSYNMDLSGLRDELLTELKNIRKEMGQEGKKVGAAISNGIEDGIKENFDDVIEVVEKSEKDLLRELEKAQKKFEKNLEKFPDALSKAIKNLNFTDLSRIARNMNSALFEVKNAAADLSDIGVDIDDSWIINMQKQIEGLADAGQEIKQVSTVDLKKASNDFNVFTRRIKNNIRDMDLSDIKVGLNLAQSLKEIDQYSDKVNETFKNIKANFYSLGEVSGLDNVLLAFNQNPSDLKNIDWGFGKASQRKSLLKEENDIIEQLKTIGNLKYSSSSADNFQTSKINILSGEFSKEELKQRIVLLERLLEVTNEYATLTKSKHLEIHDDSIFKIDNVNFALPDVISKSKDELKKFDKELSNIVYHAGDLSNISKTQKSFPLGNVTPYGTPGVTSSVFGGLTGLYTTEDVGEFWGNEWSGAPISSIDLSQYKLFDSKDNDLAIKVNEFFTNLNATIYGYLEYFDHESGELAKTTDVKTTKELYSSLKEIFHNVNLDFDTFSAFIERSKSIVAGHDFADLKLPSIDEGIAKSGISKVLQGVSKDVLNADSFPTQLMKMLGFEGIDLRGTRYNGTYSGGSVIFDVKPESLESVNEKWSDVMSRNGYEISEDDLKREEKRRQLAFDTAKAYSEITEETNKNNDGMSKLITLIGDLTKKYSGESFTNIFGETINSFEPLNADNAIVLYDALIAKDQEYQAELVNNGEKIKLVAKEINTFIERFKELSASINDSSNFTNKYELLLSEVSTGALSAADAIAQLNAYVKENNLLLNGSTSISKTENESISEQYISPFSDVENKRILKGIDVDAMAKEFNIIGEERKALYDDLSKLASLSAEMAKGDADNSIYNAAGELIGKISEYILSNGKISEKSNEKIYSDFYDYMSSNLIKYTEEDKKELGDDFKSIISRFGSGKYKILSKNEGQRIDKIWNEVLDLFPQFFDKEIINPQDQLKAYLDVVQKARDEKKNYKVNTSIPVSSDAESEAYVYSLINDFMNKAYLNAENMYKEIENTRKQEEELANAAKKTSDAKKYQVENSKLATEQVKEQAKAAKEAAKAREDLLSSGAASEVSVEELVKKDLEKALESLRSAKNNETTLINLKGVFSGEDLVDQFSSFAQKIAEQANLSVKSIEVNDDTAKIKLYNEELKVTVDQIYKLRSATQEAESAILELNKQSFKHDVKALNENNFDVDGIQQRALASIEKVRSSLHGLKYDLTDLESAAKNISSQDDFNKFNNQLKATQDAIQAIKNATTSKNSMNPLANMQRDMQNANTEINTMSLKLQGLGDIDGVDKAKSMIEEMTAAVRKYNEAQDAQSQQKAYNQYSSLRSTFDSQLKYINEAKRLESKVANTNKQYSKSQQDRVDAAWKNEFQNNYKYTSGKTASDQSTLNSMSDFYKSEEEKARQFNSNIKSIYDELISKMKQINNLTTKINDLSIKDSGTGNYTQSINSLQTQKSALIADIRSIYSEISSALNVKTGENGIAKFFDVARERAALTSEEIQKFDDLLIQADRIGFNFADKLSNKIQPLADKINALKQMISEGTISQDSDIAKNVLSADSVLQAKYSNLKNNQDASSAIELMKTVDGMSDYINMLDRVSQKEKEYFAGKTKYTQDTTMSTLSEQTEKEANKIVSAREKLTESANKFAKESGASGAIVTNFVQGADGIAKLDFSILDQGTNSLRKFRMEMGSVTDGTYVAETTINNSMSNIQAATKQLESVSALIERLKISDVKLDVDNGSVANLLQIQEKLNMELSKGSAADQTTLTKLTKDAKLSSAEVEKLYKKMLQMRSAIDGGSAIDLGKSNLNGDKYTQMSDAVKKFATQHSDATLSIGKFNEAAGKLNFTLTDGKGVVKTFQASISELDGQVIAQQTGVKQLDTAWTKFKSNISSTGRQITTALVGFNMFYKVISEIRQGITYVKEIDLALTELKKVTDETEASYENFLNTASETAGRIGSTVSDFTDATANFARLGYTIEESANMAESAIIYKNVADGLDTVEESTDSIISTMKAFGIESNDTMGIIDRFNEVGNNFAITSAGIGEALQRSASALYEAGNTIDESIGLVTAGNSVIQNPEQVGELIAHQHSNMLLANSYIG